MIKRMCPIAIAIALITGCVERDGTPSGNGANAYPAPAVPATAGVDMIELPTGAGSPEAFPLVAGSFVTGELELEPSKVVAVSMQIGNFSGTADGSLAFELCQGDRCRNGKTSLAGSTDNAFLRIGLDSALDITAGEALRYRITKLEGSRPVALWLYPPSTPGESIRINDQSRMERVPRLAIHR